MHLFNSALAHLHFAALFCTSGLITPSVLVEGQVRTSSTNKTVVAAAAATSTIKNSKIPAGRTALEESTRTGAAEGR